MKKNLQPINWFGGKGQFVSKILSFFPSHYIYVEVFGGGASVLLNKKPSPIEVYNDIDDNLVNFFRVLRDEGKFEKFQRLVELTPYSKIDFFTARDKMKMDEYVDDVERAYLFFIRYKMSFSGLGETWASSVTISRRGMAQKVSAYLAAVEGLPEVCERLRTVQIENLSFEDCIRKYDREETLFYLDPPYVHSTRSSGGYAHEMDDEEHERLVDILLGIKGKAVLSGYENEIYRRLEDNGWKKYDFDVKCRINKKSTDRRESVWVNFTNDERNINFSDI